MSRFYCSAVAVEYPFTDTPTCSSHSGTELLFKPLKQVRGIWMYNEIVVQFQIQTGNFRMYL